MRSRPTCTTTSRVRRPAIELLEKLRDPHEGESVGALAAHLIVDIEADQLGPHPRSPDGQPPWRSRDPE
jgi:hypothetical protein